MNIIRLRPDLRLEGSGVFEPPVVPFEEFKANLGFYVLSPEVTGEVADQRLKAHQRQVDFLVGGDGALQIEVNQAQLDCHSMAVRVLSDLAVGGSAEVLQFPESLPEQPLAQMTA